MKRIIGNSIDEVPTFQLMTASWIIHLEKTTKILSIRHTAEAETDKNQYIKISSQSTSRLSRNENPPTDTPAPRAEELNKVSFHPSAIYNEISARDSPSPPSCSLVQYRYNSPLRDPRRDHAVSRLFAKRQKARRRRAGFRQVRANVYIGQNRAFFSTWRSVSRTSDCLLLDGIEIG